MFLLSSIGLNAVDYVSATTTWSFNSSTNWTVPSSGNYQITIWGGPGGQGGSVWLNDGLYGKAGNKNTISLTLTQGEALNLYVGNSGGYGNSGRWWQGSSSEGDYYGSNGAGGSGGSGYTNGSSGQNGSSQTVQFPTRTYYGGGGGGGGGSSAILRGGSVILQAQGGSGGDGAKDSDGPSGGAGGSGGGTGGVHDSTHYEKVQNYWGNWVDRPLAGKIEITQLNSPPNLVVTTPSQNKYFV